MESIFQNEKDQLSKLAKRLNDLSNYSFALGIENAFVELSINDNLSINAADYLYIQEYGSALNGIIATHPIEKTMHECKSIIDNAYSSCIDKILQNSLTNIEEKAILKKAAMTISNMLKQNADSKISKYVSCFVKYKGIKI